jgi:hypothetical protein
VDKEALLRRRMPEADVELPGVGTIRVRGLTRAEVMAGKQAGSDPATLERHMLVVGIVDPPLTADEVAQWYDSSPAGEIEPVSTRIAELSGLLEDSSKAAYKSAGD